MCSMCVFARRAFRKSSSKCQRVMLSLFCNYLLYGKSYCTENDKGSFGKIVRLLGWWLPIKRKYVDSTLNVLDVCNLGGVN